MQSYTRRQLKQDKFADATKEAVHWTVEHRNTMVAAAALVALALAAYMGWTYYIGRQEDQASIEFGKAVQTYAAPVRPATEANLPGGPRTFPSIAERSNAAINEFQQVAEKYPRTKNGQYARYMAGIAALDKGDNAAAEQQLKKAAEGNKETAALAKFALAGVYRSEGKTDEAAKTYREVIAADATTVAKSQAQLALAEMYEPKNPAEAVKVYEDIIKGEQEKVKDFEKENKDLKAPPKGSEPLKTPLQQQAEAKIQQLKTTANKK